MPSLPGLVPPLVEQLAPTAPLLPGLDLGSATGLTERLIYREFFPVGLTAFDSLETSLLGVKPSLSHVVARQEVRQLLSIVDPTASEKSDPWGSVPSRAAS
jgi:chromosome partitioning protein